MNTIPTAEMTLNWDQYKRILDIPDFDFPGVYALCMDAENWFYIGMSKKVLYRIAQHTLGAGRGSNIFFWLREDYDSPKVQDLHFHIWPQEQIDEIWADIGIADDSYDLHAHMWNLVWSVQERLWYWRENEYPQRRRRDFERWLIEHHGAWHNQNR